jgi:thiol:disulfide interchange protein DsbC
MMNPGLRTAALAAMLLALGAGAAAQQPAGKPAARAEAAQPTSGHLPPALDSQVRKALAERVPSLGKVDEISRTPIPNLFEVRVGSEIFYADPTASYLVHGQIIDTKAKRNLTEERIDKLLAIDFDTLPLKDAFVIVRGNGKRKLAVFEDPNCGYCKRFERDLQKIDNVTVYMFLYPILGADSVEKSKAIWCAKDRGAAWLDWMVRDKTADKPDEKCDITPITRNVAYGRANKITGTPTLLFTDGTRVPGAIGSAEVEKLLAGK